MTDAITLTGLGVIFAIALWRIWGWEMIVDIFLSPVRRYDFDEDPKHEEKAGGKG